MTQHDDDADDDTREIERLRTMLKTSERHLLQQVEEPPNGGGGGPSSNGKKRKRNGPLRGGNETTSHDDTNGAGSGQNWYNGVASGLLSADLLAEGAARGLATNTDAQNPLIVLPGGSSRKKQKTAAAVVTLTREEVREAKALQKKTARKLQQLETRAAQKTRRADLYRRLEESNRTSQALALQPLLVSSGKLSRKGSDTKKQSLKKILNRERAGLALTEGEKDLLYPERTVQEWPPTTSPTRSSHSESTDHKSAKIVDRKPIGTGIACENQTKPHQKGEVDDASVGVDHETMPGMRVDEYDKVHAAGTENEVSSSGAIPSGLDFAAQMMASLSKLKDESKTTKQEATKSSLSDMATSLEPEKRYVPTNPAILKTAAAMEPNPSLLSNPGPSKRAIVEVKRPADVEKIRFDLPVTAMEFEIMDAIRNNDVTIICGETGSGKSTQIPAYLYEAGMSHRPGSSETSFLIGITQPRRVAAVSTAKRVCYEMGQGNGQAIRGSNGNGNLVAYRTRYETAGTGRATRIQFMTDGILLSEIQNDLLLRRYSVIVLDESHERNLNTDVLIGLLSKALPLRKKAAEEDPSIVPLKLILMSATLRVEDFTQNEMLFPTGPPAVVTVPGRTHPVTVHHSKTTELDDYGKVEVTCPLVNCDKHCTKLAAPSAF